ncbi:hypothetical protein EVAR_7762_1 [Eumeta japonica]|uniref:Uncharacterized protein n=1 Tax=Eumeta variegata TaxID=151549 RepID=A0A4C1TLJ8_EUMVA|nr:hypothetical protein EVAR_7762_1 [Eumeta japonica]
MPYPAPLLGTPVAIFMDGTIERNTAHSLIRVTLLSVSIVSRTALMLSSDVAVEGRRSRKSSAEVTATHAVHATTRGLRGRRAPCAVTSSYTPVLDWDGGLIFASCRASSRRGYDPDGSGGNGLNHWSGLVPVPSPHRRGRARSSRMRSRQVEGIRLDGWCSTRWGGRLAQAGHVVDRWWSDAGGRRPDQGGASVTRVGVDLTESACRPLVRLSTRGRQQPEGSTCQRAASFNLLVLSRSGLQVNPVPAPTTRGARVTAAPGDGWGHRVVKRWLTRGGREAEQAAHAADRRWLSTHPRQQPGRYVPASRVLPLRSSLFNHPSSSSSTIFCLDFNLQSGAYAGPPRARARHCAYTQRGWGHGLPSGGMTRAEARLSHAASASRSLLLAPALVWVVFPNDEGPKHRFTIRIIVPTMSGKAPRRLQCGRRAASDTSASGRRRGGRTSALGMPGVAAVPEPPAFYRLKCGDIGFGAMMYVRDSNKVEVVVTQIMRRAGPRACSATHGC